MPSFRQMYCWHRHRSRSFCSLDWQHGGICERPRWLKRKRYRKKLIGCIENCIGWCICKNIYKFQFIYSILYKPCIFKAYRLLNVQTLCIFPCFCPYEPKQGKFLFSADYLIQQSCGSTLRFPCSVSVNVHCGTNISVSEKFLHIFRCCTV